MTRSPGSTRILFSRILPARCPSTVCPESNSTRKTALGKLSMTLPSSSMVCLLGSLLPKCLRTGLVRKNHPCHSPRRSAPADSSKGGFSYPNLKYYLRNPIHSKDLSKKSQGVLISILIFCLNLGMVFCQDGAKEMSTRSISGLDKIISLVSCLVLPEIRPIISEVSTSEMARDS